MGRKGKEAHFTQTGCLVSVMILSRLTQGIPWTVLEKQEGQPDMSALLSLSTAVPAASRVAIRYMVG